MITNFQGALQQILGAMTMKKIEDNASNIKATKEEANSKIEQTEKNVADTKKTTLMLKEAADKSKALIGEDSEGNPLEEKEASEIEKDYYDVDRRVWRNDLAGRQKARAQHNFDRAKRQYSEEDKNTVELGMKAQEAAHHAQLSLEEREAVKRANKVVAKNALSRLSKVQAYENKQNYKEKNYGSFEDFPEKQAELAPQKTKQGV